MIMLVHVPFSELKNMEVVLNEFTSGYACYGTDYGHLVYFFKINDKDSESHIIEATQGTNVRFSFQDDYGKETGIASEYFSNFGDEALKKTYSVTPESVGFPETYNADCIIKYHPK